MRSGAFVLLVGTTMMPLLAAQEVGVASVFHSDQRVTVPNLVQVVATDASHPAVAKAALTIILSGFKIKCDPGSRLDDVLEAYGDSSLRELAGKMSGASCTMQDGKIDITATFQPNGEIQGDNLLASLLAGKPLLVDWKGGLYALYGAVYDETLYYDGRKMNVIRKLLMIDPRYSDERRFVEFVRGTDDFTQVQGVVTVGAIQR